MVADKPPLLKDVDIIIVPAGTKIDLPPDAFVMKEFQIRNITGHTRYVDPATGEQVRLPGSTPGEIAETKYTIRTDWKEAERGR